MRSSVRCRNRPRSRRPTTPGAARCASRSRRPSRTRRTRGSQTGRRRMPRARRAASGSAPEDSPRKPRSAARQRPSACATCGGNRRGLGGRAPRAVEQAPVAEALRSGGEGRRRAAPPQLVDVAESGASVRSVARSLNSSASSRLSPSTSGGKSSSAAVRFDQPRRGHLADARRCRDSRPPRRRRARGSRESAPGRRRTSRARPSALRTLLLLAIDLHDAVAAHALREILVGRPDATFSTRRRPRRDARGRGQRVVGLELDHRPDGDAHRARAPPRAAGTARAAPARCRRRSCSPARGRCGTTR